jgi:adenine-specific DNA glycosylase
MRIDLYLVTDRKGRVLMRRERGPLMDAMYHLPHGDTSLLTGKPLHALRRDLLGSFRHTVTNRRIEFALYRCGAGDLAGARQRNTYAWIHPDDLASVPHPSYVRKALRLASGKL